MLTALGIILCCTQFILGRWLIYKPSMYADDHQIYYSGHDSEEVTTRLSVSADQATEVVRIQLTGWKP